MTVSKKCKVSC